MRKICFSVLAGVSSLIPVFFAHRLPLGVAIAQPADSGELYYYYFGQKIPLKLRQDVIAAEGKAPGQLSGSEPYFRTLRRHLRGGGTLSGDDNRNPPGLQLDSIGDQYVLVGLSSQVQREEIQKQIQAEPNLKGMLPVLTLGDRASSMLVLPNRILVSFKAGTSESVIQATLKRQNLAIIIKQPFTETGYVVRSTSATGTAILNVANQLGQEASVEYATPDFIQVPTGVPDGSLNKALDRQSTDNLLDILRKLPQQAYSPTAPRLLPLQWHLHSAPLSQCLQASTVPWNCLFKSPATSQSTVKRIDIRAKEAWAATPSKGRGVVVAVIDSGVQANHEDLAGSLHRVNNPACPKETAGWDFTNESDQGTGCLTGDPMAAIDPQETVNLREKLRDSVILSDSELIQKYPRAEENVKRYCRDNKQQCSPDTITKVIRSSLKGYVTSSFHGTNVAGVIAANAPDGKGLLGVSPNAKILPIRALGLGGTGQSSAILNAIRYAAARKVDVINLSLGPSVPFVDQA
ncbi:MAG: S8 family serine peptidase, partial [Synechococcales bacterium]|nr:S8 family serine peptidase [Synechococcales bacterium]